MIGLSSRKSARNLRDKNVLFSRLDGPEQEVAMGFLHVSESRQTLDANEGVTTALLGAGTSSRNDSDERSPRCRERTEVSQDSLKHTRGVRVLPVHHPSHEDEFLETSLAAATWMRTGSLAASWRDRASRILKTMLPCVSWITNYDVKECLRADLMAGLTVGIMLVPQAMSYAKLAGLPPIYGLYSGFVPIFVYAAVGSSRQLAVGPVALVSLLVSDGLSSIIDERKDSEAYMDEYIRMAILLAFLVGCLEAAMGLIRLGWIVRFISHSVTSGFTSGAAVIIGLSQTKYFVGYDVSRSSAIIVIIQSIIKGADKFQWHPFVMGMVTLAVLLIMKEVGKNDKKFWFLRASGPITAVVLGTLFYKIVKPSHITAVGSIPKGLPPLSLNYEWRHVVDLLPTASIITGVAVLESVGIAKALAARNGYEIDSNKELFGLGLANIFGSIFSAYPVTGSFSRSAVNNDMGAKTPLSGLVMGLLIWATLLFLTPLFSEIPQCTLGAIVISAVLGLIDYQEAMFLWKVERRDFFLWMAACVGTMLLGIEIGVIIAVFLSLVFVIYESANPHMAVLGRLPGTTVYRNISQYPDAYTYQGIVVVRVDAPIYFANISFVKEKLQKYELRSGPSIQQGGSELGRVRFVILEMSPVTYVDSTAIHAFKELYHEYQARKIQLAFSNPNPNVMVTLSKAGIPQLLGREWYFVRVHDAVQVCLSYLQEEQGVLVAENQHISVKRETRPRNVSHPPSTAHFTPTITERSLSQQDPFRTGSDRFDCESTRKAAPSTSPHLCEDYLP